MYIYNLVDNINILNKQNKKKYCYQGKNNLTRENCKKTR